MKDSMLEIGLYAFHDSKYGFYGLWTDTNDEIALINAKRYIPGFAQNFDRKDMSVWRLGSFGIRSGITRNDREMILDVGAMSESSFKDIVKDFWKSFKIEGVDNEE